MNALTRIHAGLVRGGVLLDLHPTAPDAHVEGGGASLGFLGDAEFLAMERAADAGLDEAVRAGLFTLEKELTLVVVDRFDSAEELLTYASGRRGSRVPETIPPRVRAASHPFEVHHTLVLRRLRALEPVSE